MKTTQREIKFRAWTGTKMIYGDLSQFIWSMGHQCAEDVSLEEEVGAELAAFQNRETEKTIMQFTGLLDKNGKEIYEGDIVRFDKWGICKIVWNSGISAFQYSYININDAWVTGTLYDFEVAEKIEIIGNIYENKTLITLVGE